MEVTNAFNKHNKCDCNIYRKLLEIGYIINNNSIEPYSYKTAIDISIIYIAITIHTNEEGRNIIKVHIEKVI